MTGGRNGGGTDSAAQWEADWRANVSHQLEESADKHQQTAIILERIIGQLRQHDDEFVALKARPAEMRANIGTYGGCSSTAIMLTMMTLNAIMGLSGLIISIIAIIHHP